MSNPVSGLLVLWPALVVSAAASTASAAPLPRTSPPLNSSDVVMVHGDWDDDSYEERRHWRRHHRDHHVDAPYTHVESGRRVVVDAPFAHVYVGRHGRRVIAPFVDLWIPRR